MTERRLAALQRIPLAQIAIDEAHCISRWGPSFRPEYEALARLPEIFPGVPLAAFTATADAATRQDLAAKLMTGPGGKGGRSFLTGFDRPNIQLAVEPPRASQTQPEDFVAAQPGAPRILSCLSRTQPNA